MRFLHKLRRPLRRLVLYVALVGAIPAASQPTAPTLLARGQTSGAEPHEIALWSYQQVLWVTLDGVAPRQPLSTEVALRLLADNHAQSLWQPLVKYAGPNLEGLRDMLISASAKALLDPRADPVPHGTDEAIAEPQARAILQHADALANGGRIEEAITLLRARRGGPPRDPGQAQDYVSLTLSLAGLLRLRDGSPDGAAAVLREARGLVDAVYAINFDVNLAAYLAAAGRYADALAMIEAAETSFLQNSAEELGEERANVPGSLRQFSWIRACALQGLGRVEEARRAFSLVLSAVEPRQSVYALSPNAEIRLRAKACMRDVEGLVDEFVAQLDSGLPDQPVFTWVQPAKGLPLIDPSTVAAVRRHPRLIAAMRDRVRVLPAHLAPALNDWRRDAAR